jgi:chemotaxis protein MotB
MAFQEDPPAGVPEWLVTFGDMMSLLLTFFIMLVSMSEMKSESRVASAVEAMKKQFGRDKDHQPGASRSRGAKIEAPVGPNAQVKGVRPGKHVMVGGSVLFGEHDVVPSDDERMRLKLIADQFQGKLQRIEIRGHTSRRPLPKDSKLNDHFDLAYSRCREVQRLLVEMGLDAKRMRLTVAGPNEPSYSGDDLQLRKQNSRVEAYLLNEYSNENDYSADTGSSGAGGAAVRTTGVIP